MDYIIAGAPQSGTTWTSLCLEEHPECYVPTHEEIHFFDWHYEKGAEWYYRMFNEANEDQVRIDICPHYMYVDDISEKIKKVVPDVEVLFILRDPIGRAYSHYCKELRNGLVSENVDEEMGLDSKYIRKSRYSKYIGDISKYFSTKVFLFEEMKNNNKKFIKEIYKYVGVDVDKNPSWIGKKVNQRKKNVDSNILQRISFVISKTLSNFKWGDKIVRKVRYNNLLNPVYEILGKKYPKMSPQHVSLLEDTLKSESKYLDEEYSVETKKLWFNN